MSVSSRMLLNDVYRAAAQQAQEHKQAADQKDRSDGHSHDVPQDGWGDLGNTHGPKWLPLTDF